MKTDYNRIEEIVEKFLNDIGEYVDACQILLSNHDSDNTTFYDKGFGNYFTRTGMIREFIEKDKARTNYSVKETEFNNNEDKDYE